jgi:hypothetical protein
MRSPRIAEESFYGRVVYAASRHQWWGMESVLGFGHVAYHVVQ